ncbi:MAG: hypothetical protein RLZZ241_352 [Bacteroidota bacterium]
MRLLLLLLMLPVCLIAQESRILQGKITDGTVPLPDVTVVIEGASSGTYTNAQGHFDIEARNGDILVFSYTGMVSRRIRVEEVTRFVNLALSPDYTELEEVTVLKRLKTQEELSREYASNKDVIRTAFGFMDAVNTQSRIRVIDGTEINAIYLCISDFLKNRFAGVFVNGSCPTGAVYIRNIGSINNRVPVIYDIDGQVFTETPNWLDVNSIYRMAIVSSYAMGTRYGSQGAGGVIVINTVNSKYVAQGLAKVTPKVAPNALTEAELLANGPTYLQALKGAQTTEQAQDLYRNFETQYTASPYYFLDAYSHFYEDRRDFDFADKLISDHLYLLNGNPVLLKALGYIYQAQGRFDRALEVFKEVFMLRPQYSQSYLDMANAYRDNGEYAKAASMFGRYQYLLQEGLLLGSDTFWLMQQHDSDNLFATRNQDFGKLANRLSTDPYLEGATRLVFEWNETGAEFELQFVNPNNQHYTWEHTFAKNGTRMDDEQMAGYAMEEYVIDTETPGNWNVNVTNYGNPSLSPTYLKMTVYRNYGTPDQRKQIRTFKLFLKGSNRHLITVNVPGPTGVQNP